MVLTSKNHHIKIPASMDMLLYIYIYYIIYSVKFSYNKKFLRD